MACPSGRSPGNWGSTGGRWIGCSRRRGRRAMSGRRRDRCSILLSRCCGSCWRSGRRSRRRGSPRSCALTMATGARLIWSRSAWRGCARARCGQRRRRATGPLRCCSSIGRRCQRARRSPAASGASMRWSPRCRSPGRRPRTSALTCHRSRSWRGTSGRWSGWGASHASASTTISVRWSRAATATRSPGTAASSRSGATTPSTPRPARRRHRGRRAPSRAPSGISRRGSGRRGGSRAWPISTSNTPTGATASATDAATPAAGFAF